MIARREHDSANKKTQRDPQQGPQDKYRDDFYSSHGTVIIQHFGKERLLTVVIRWDEQTSRNVGSTFQISGWERWRKLILPGIFPYLVTGLVTASGGAWNASIVAEYFHFKGETYTTMGLGAIISNATDSGQFHVLLTATILMAAAVVTINRLLWRRLYRLAETRFRLET